MINPALLSTVLSDDLCIDIDTPTPARHPGGRPKGSVKVREPKQVILKVRSYDQVIDAMRDILWRSGAKLKANQIIALMDTGNLERRRIYGILNSAVHLQGVGYGVEYIFNHKTKASQRIERFWMDSPRTGWYYRGTLWSELALSNLSHCKVTRKGLAKRLKVQGLSVDDALKTERTDNAK